MAQKTNRYNINGEIRETEVKKIEVIDHTPKIVPVDFNLEECVKLLVHIKLVERAEKIRARERRARRREEENRIVAELLRKAREGNRVAENEVRHITEDW